VFFSITDGFSRWTWGFAGLVIFGLLGILETIIQRVELVDDELVVVTMWGRRRYDRRRIVKATREKGVLLGLLGNQAK